MRQDMGKLMVQTLRHGAGETYRYHREKSAIDEEEVSKRISMRSPYKWGRKEFGENFTPIIRFLKSNTGRPWNKVNSEIVRDLRGSGVVMDHARGHIKGFVEQHAFLVNKKPHTLSMFSNEPRPLRPGELWVDPNGILRMVPETSRKPKRLDAFQAVINLSDKEVAVFWKGVWYKSTTAVTPWYVPGVTTVTDAYVGMIYLAGQPSSPYVRIPSGSWQERLVRGHVYKPLYDNAWRSTELRYAISRQQLSKKELRRLGLKNE